MSASTHVVAAEEADVRLDRWLKRHFPELGHAHLQKLVRTGQVRIDGRRASAGARLSPGQIVRLPPLACAPRTVRARPYAVPSAADAAFLRGRILHRDDDIIAIDKPAGLAVQGGSGTQRHLDALLDALRFDGERPRLVHRLDKDTSGVLVLARNVAQAARLAAAFRSRTLEKIYWALSVGVPVPAAGRIDLALAKRAGMRGERIEPDAAGRAAVTLYTCADSVGKAVALVVLRPLTGRTHQLRAHMAALGTPILGDGRYGAGAPEASLAEFADELHLHARSLVVPDRSGRALTITAPLPPHFAKTLAALGLDAALAERCAP